MTAPTSNIAAEVRPQSWTRSVVPALWLTGFVAGIGALAGVALKLLSLGTFAPHLGMGWSIAILPIGLCVLAPMLIIAAIAERAGRRYIVDEHGVRCLRGKKVLWKVQFEDIRSLSQYQDGRTCSFLGMYNEDEIFIYLPYRVRAIYGVAQEDRKLFQEVLFKKLEEHGVTLSPRYGPIVAAIRLLIVIVALVLLAKGLTWVVATYLGDRPPPPAPSVSPEPSQTPPARDHKRGGILKESGEF